jgi:single-stranded DNA-binding protein
LGTTLRGRSDQRFDPSRSVLDTSAESLAKGNRAAVLGRLRTRAWETPEGENRSVTEIDADEVAPSLRWAIAKPERAERSRNGQRQTEPGERRPAAVLSDPFETASAPREAWGPLAC